VVVVHVVDGVAFGACGSSDGRVEVVIMVVIVVFALVSIGVMVVVTVLAIDIVKIMFFIFQACGGGVYRCC
jgi:hypothetical protein